ncbi:MAG: C10 family peptidase [Muribaculaceae bacterium]|nr:C10 family peptidase [Muribaculaceae bacterium]
MKKKLLLIAMVMFSLHLSAALVDVSTAQMKAQQYLKSTVYAGKYMAPTATQPTLIMTEMGDVNKNTPVFYIFNTSTTFVIVSGDDRAEEILAYGDKPLNLDRIPCNMRAWLDIYKRQLDWLISNPDVQVEKPTTYKSPKIRSTIYGPLLTAIWDQEAPFNNQCKFTYNGTTYTCLTGCPATSASMVLYYWKYPTAPVGPFDSYSSTLDIGSYYSNEVNFTYPALFATTFDWDNMLDDYTGSYNTVQGTAVATLMRYVGQAEHMMYGVSGSGIYTTEAQNVADMFIAFDYDETTCRLVHKEDYSETQWAALLQEEMAEGRPVVFMAVSGGWFGGGHAFNVDGYNSSTNKYHVNFGWSGDGNNWYSMNAFGYSGSTYNEEQQMVIGIQPNTTDPRLRVSDKELSLNCAADATVSKIFTVTGINLLEDVTITVNDENEVFSVDLEAVDSQSAANGKEVTVYFNPKDAATYNATITLSTAGANDVTISLTGKGTKSTIPAPVVNDATEITNNSFKASWSFDNPANVTYTLNVSSINGSTVANITDITDMFYTVTGLNAGATYYFNVKAIPVIPTAHNASPWGNSKSVTLLNGPALELGDLDGNGEVDVTDVNILINIILGKDQAENYGNRVYVTNDEDIDVTDVNAVINIILKRSK